MNCRECCCAMLEAPETDAVHEHLATCPGCRAFQRAQARLGAVAAPTFEPPPPLDAAIRARARQSLARLVEAAPGAPRAAGRRPWRFMRYAAAAMLAVAFTVALIASRRTEGPTAATVVRVAPAPAPALAPSWFDTNLEAALSGLEAHLTPVRSAAPAGSSPLDQRITECEVEFVFSLDET